MRKENVCLVHKLLMCNTELIGSYYISNITDKVPNDNIVFKFDFNSTISFLLM